MTREELIAELQPELNERNEREALYRKHRIASIARKITDARDALALHAAGTNARIAGLQKELMEVPPARVFTIEEVLGTPNKE